MTMRSMPNGGNPDLGIPGGMFGSIPAVDPRIAQIANAPATPKRGMFGGAQIDLGRAIAGYLAGIGNPAGVQALQAMNEHRREQERMAQEQQQYQRERQDKQTDWQSQYDYKLAHPEQGDDEYTRALTASGVQPGSPEWAQHMANRAGILENPPRYVMVNGALVQVGGGQSAPSAPKPLTDDDIIRMQGGQSPQGSGGFPGR